ncbi:hypothetical protein F4780DRAFT_741062 [Xylariomycetidae sp. FL0641]|nr:hypothetical protein F4780DRAFT_741062 [Xylariomycetidae sp. FL0641]
MSGSESSGDEAVRLARQQLAIAQAKRAVKQAKKAQKVAEAKKQTEIKATAETQGAQGAQETELDKKANEQTVKDAKTEHVEDAEPKDKTASATHIPTATAGEDHTAAEKDKDQGKGKDKDKDPAASASIYQSTNRRLVAVQNKSGVVKHVPETELAAAQKDGWEPQTQLPKPIKPTKSTEHGSPAFQTDSHGAIPFGSGPSNQRPDRVGAGWGDHDDFASWQSMGRNVTMDMLEGRPQNWTRDALQDSMTFVREGGPSYFPAQLTIPPVRAADGEDLPRRHPTMTAPKTLKEMVDDDNATKDRPERGEDGAPW